MLTLDQLRRAERRIDTYKDPPRYPVKLLRWATINTLALEHAETCRRFDAWMDRLERLARRRAELRRRIYSLASSERLELWARALKTTEGWRVAEQRRAVDQFTKDAPDAFDDLDDVHEILEDGRT
jgi:hypothetical protein